MMVIRPLQVVTQKWSSILGLDNRKTSQVKTWQVFSKNLSEALINVVRLAAEYIVHKGCA